MPGSVSADRTTANTPADVDAGVIEEARARQRRRRMAGGVAVAMIAAKTGIVLGVSREVASHR